MITVVAIIFLIFVTIFTPIVIILIYKNENRTIVKNGVRIRLNKTEYEAYQNSVEEKYQAKLRKQKEQKEQELLKLRSNSILLKRKIKESFENENDYIRKKVLERLTTYVCETEEEYKELEFLYNNGLLRSEEEITMYYRNKELENFDFNSTRHKVNIFAWCIPFFTTFIAMILGIKDFKELPIIGVPIALTAALFTGLIGMIIGHSINLSIAKSYNIPEDDPDVKCESTNQKVAIASAITAGIYVTHKTKKAIKDIGNVDSWEEMK